jgi:ribosomal protein S2
MRGRFRIELREFLSSAAPNVKEIVAKLLIARIKQRWFGGRFTEFDRKQTTPLETVSR